MDEGGRQLMCEQLKEGQHSKAGDWQIGQWEGCRERGWGETAGEDRQMRKRWQRWPAG